MRSIGEMGFGMSSAMLQSTNLTILAWRQWLWKEMQGWGNEKDLYNRYEEMD